MGYMVSVPTNVTVNMCDLWENMLGGGYFYHEWFSDFRELDSDNPLEGYDDDNNPKPQNFRVWEHDEMKWHNVTLDKLARGYVKLKTDGWTHCGGHHIDEEDACTGAAILQQAIFGEQVYG
jgi:hypothetical protein